MSENRTSNHAADKGQTTRSDLPEAAAIITATGYPSADVYSPPQAVAPSNRPTRQLGQTGAMVEIVSLGGEGILRTNGQHKSAVPMIEEALRLGVRYIDTAPAYQQSQDYYGAAFRNLGTKVRDQVFLASKTHRRQRDAALALLDDSLERLGTDRLDLWQLHDLRSQNDLDHIFSKGGAIEAVEKAKADGRVRFVGITGHHDPAILVEAMRRYPVDTVLCAINPADRARSPFLTSVIPEARRRKVGVIGMKIMAAGRLLRDAADTPEELIHYAASHTDTVIIGCSSIAEVRQNLAVRDTFKPLTEGELAALEARIAPYSERYDTFKA
jgi:aryl-alcohol dehydrogenase-like predicted oxidoreductase